jgi:DNA-binding MarR family transcriptional regulator
VSVVLTDDGKREVDSALTDLLERERAILAALSAHEQASLATALRTLVTEFDD